MSANFPFTIPQNMYIFSLQTRRNIPFPSSWFMCFSIIFPEEIFLMGHLINHRRKKGEALGTKTPSLSLSFLTRQASPPGLSWTPWQAEPSSPAYPEHPDRASWGPNSALLVPLQTERSSDPSLEELTQSMQKSLSAPASSYTFCFCPFSWKITLPPSLVAVFHGFGNTGAGKGQQGNWGGQEAARDGHTQLQLWSTPRRVGCELLSSP